jgi:Transglutaminase-like superfamily
MTTKKKQVLRWLVVLGVVVACTQAFASDQAVTEFDRWYVLQVAGEHAGYIHTTERHKADKIITQTDMKISIRRGDQTVTMEHAMWFVETEDGKPVEASSTLKPGALAIVYRFVFNEDGIEQTTGQGDLARTLTLPPLDPSYLPPAAAQRLIEKQITSGREQFTAKVIDASMGVNALDTSMTLVGRENVEVFGKVVPAVAWDMTVSNMPGVKVRAYVDERGYPVKTAVQFLPGMDMVMIQADEQLAKAQVNPPEVMAGTLIRPDKPIAGARSLRRAIYRVSIPGRDGTSLHLPRSGYQRVVYDNQTTAAVVLDMDNPVNVIDDLPNDSHLESSHMIDHENPKVRELLRKALPGDTADLSDYQKASRLRAFVYNYIDEKDLSVGLASAGEAAQTAQGDCTEHAVLLTALLRAEGIPSRTVSGLLYVDEFLGESGVFGYHMWAQAWLEAGGKIREDAGDEGGQETGKNTSGGGRWVDFDGVLDGTDFDAAHIQLSVSSMRDGQMINDMVDMLPLLGGLEVQVIEAE